MFRNLAFSSAIVAAISSTVAAELDQVNVSIQPAYHAIPIYAAKKFGWFEELELEINLSLYASGGPQVQDAVDNKAWDFGIAGSVPSVLAGSQGIFTIGINNDESATTEVVGAPGVTEFPPQTLTDGIFQATKDSTGELLLRKCLDAVGLSFNDNHIAYAPQPDILNNLESKLTSYGSLWAPNTYSYQDNFPGGEGKVFCTGKDVGFPILGGLMVREEYAESNPDTVARLLAAYLRGVAFMQNNALHEEVMAVSREFHGYAEVPISDMALEEDLFLRPLFNLDQQLDAMDRNHANNYISGLDAHYMELEEFLFNHGVISKTYEPREYVTSAYMEMVSNNPELRVFAYAGSSGLVVSSTSQLSAGDIVGIAVGVVGALCLLAAIVVLFYSKRPSNAATAPVVFDGVHKEAAPEAV